MLAVMTTLYLHHKHPAKHGSVTLQTKRVGQTLRGRGSLSDQSGHTQL